MVPSEEEIAVSAEVISKAILRANPDSETIEVVQMGYLNGFLDGYTQGIREGEALAKEALNNKNNLIKSYELRLKQILEKVN